MAASRLAVAKDIFNLLRDASLFVIVVMLLVFPKSFNTILTNAGFEEGRFLELKWKAQLISTNTDVQIANETIGKLNSINSDLRRALSQQSGAGGNKETVDLTAESQRVSEQVEKVQNSLALTLQNNAPLVERAIQSQAASEPTWVVVVANVANKGDAENFVHSASKQIAEAFPGMNYKLCVAPISSGGFGIGIYPPLTLAEAQSVRTALSTKRLLGRSDAWLNPSSRVSFASQGC
jgi:hypothetical protein